MPPVGALNSKHLINGFTINAPKPDGYPRAKLDTVPGWRSQAETAGGDGVARTGDIGEDFNPATSIGKTITYKGRLQAAPGAAKSTIEDYGSALSAACADRSSTLSVLVLPWWSSEQWVYKGRIMSFDGDDEQDRDWNFVPSPWQDAFDLNVRMKDGRFYWWNESGTPGDFMSWIDAASVVVANSGNAPTDPIITVAGVGAGQDVHLIRGVPGGTDLNLWFRGLPAGELIVDFSVRRAFMDGLLIDVTDHYDELSSSWWDEGQFGIPPGVHTITKGPGTGTSIKVDLFSASW